jgi:putative hydrolase of the HAD superfamily
MDARMPSTPRILILDVDNTLYPSDSGVMQEIGRRIGEYLIAEYGLSQTEARVLRDTYVNRYGTTLAGLRAHDRVDSEHYLHFVHDFDVSRFLERDEALNQSLHALNLLKVVWTNGTRPHALRVLEVLGITHHISTLIDVRDMGFVSKPAPEAYEILVKRPIVPPSECILVEDSVRNLSPAKSMGMHTVLVGGTDGTAADVCISSIHQIAKAVEQLLK